MNRKVIAQNFCVYIFFLILICFLFLNKRDFYVDELLTFNLANASEWFSPEVGVVYSPASKPFVDAMASDGHFDLKHVWHQQEDDTHPPFYYVLVHAVCTLFPGTVSIRYAAVVNMAFALLTLFVYRKIVRLLIDDERVIFWLSIAFCLSAGVLEIIPFLRMYVMSMFFITLLSFETLSAIDKSGIKHFIFIAITSIFGALTHYYYIIYAFCLFSVFTCILVCQKRFKEILGYLFTIFVSGAGAYLIFPAMMKHLFEGQQGSRSIENLKTSNIADRIKGYIEIINPKLFGYTLGFMITIIAVLLLIDLINSEKNGNKAICKLGKMEAYRIICLLLPATFYIIIVSKSAPLIDDRYVSPIYAVVIVGFWCLLYLSFKNVYGNSKARNTIFFTFVIFTSIVGLVSSKWQYLYRDSDVRLSNAASCGGDSEAIVLFGSSWRINPYYLEISECKSSVFYQMDSYEQFDKEVDVESLPNNIAFFLIDMDDKGFISDFVENHKDYSIILDNGAWTYGHSYYLSKLGAEY